MKRRFIMKTKSMGQVFTPSNIVSKILDSVNYINENVLFFKIMEPSFGDGAFLMQIIERIIENGRKNGFSDEQIVNCIQNNVFGVEKDEKLYTKAVERLCDKMREHGIDKDVVFPNLFNADTFDLYHLNQEKFDCVVGNPPYLSIWEIETKDEIRKFKFTNSGMTDLYIAFFEMGLHMLKPNGKLGYITPNSYFTSVAGNEMRNCFAKENILFSVYDYGHYQVFDNAQTYACITVLDKTGDCFDVRYQKHGSSERILQYKDFYINGKFYFSATKSFCDIMNYSGEKFCSVKNGCATLWDDFFINSELAKKSSFSIPIVKSSTGQRYKCFYPYNKEGKAIPYCEIEKDEVTAKILLANKERLLNRNIHDTSLWYAFGRTHN